MIRKATLIAAACGIFLSADVAFADDGLNIFDEDLSVFGVPRPLGHQNPRRVPEHSASTAVDTKIAHALRESYRDDGLGTYREDLSEYGTGPAAVRTLASNALQ